MATKEDAMPRNHGRTKPTTSFTLEPKQIAFLEETAAACKSTRSWVLGRIIDLFMLAPKNLTITTLATTPDEEGEQVA
jgi:hypothetical protein